MVTVYNMEEFARECVRMFCELTGYARTRVATAPTPFLDESNDPFTVLQGDIAQPGRAGESAQGGKADTKVAGTLASIATMCFMRIMYF